MAREVYKTETSYALLILLLLYYFTFVPVAFGF